jgi:aspartyl protease family protein
MSELRSRYWRPDRKVRKFEALVFSETIDLESEGGGLVVQAVIGLEPVKMLIDSGASIVLIPRELAEQLKIKPADDAKDMTLRTADGRRIAAKQIFLPRLRVGQFEVENVEAALLETAIDGTRPLLGLSFLSKFRFEIDSAQKKLTLLKINESEDD